MSENLTASATGPDLSMAAAAYRGEIVYIYAFDIAYDMKRERIANLLGQPVAQFAMGPSKRTPRGQFFFAPQMVRLPTLTCTGPGGRDVTVERTVKIFPIGAISITVRVPFEVARFSDLVDYHEPRLGQQRLDEQARALAEQVLGEAAPYCIRPVASIREGEAYTVFRIQSPVPASGGTPRGAEAWLADHRREVAALLTQEPDVAHLSEQEAAETTGAYLSYYDHDLIVIDWDAALVIDSGETFHETLHVLELANVQLAELTVYDTMLDEALQRSYRALASRKGAERKEMDQLRELRVDLARLSDELGNITKFFGDWHLARVYQQVSARFHLADWNRGLDEKLSTVRELHQLLKLDQTNRLMLLLELTIVILFILDLLVLLVPVLRH